MRKNLWNVEWWTYRASCWDRRCGDQDSRRPISCARPLPRPWTRSSGDVSVAPSGSFERYCLDGTSSLPRESARCLVDNPATGRKPARTCPPAAAAPGRSTFLVSESRFPIFNTRVYTPRYIRLATFPLFEYASRFVIARPPTKSNLNHYDWTAGVLTNVNIYECNDLSSDWKSFTNHWDQTYSKYGNIWQLYAEIFDRNVINNCDIEIRKFQISKAFKLSFFITFISL